VAQQDAASRSGLLREGRVVTAMLGEWRIMQVSGKTALAALQGCGGADVLILNQPDSSTGASTGASAGDTARPCLVYDAIRLRETGALALDQAADGALRIVTSGAAAGNRPWNGRSGAPDAPLVLMRQ
jgi:competence protein ComEC